MRRNGRAWRWPALRKLQPRLRPKGAREVRRPGLRVSVPALPYASECDRNRLTIHAPGTVAAQKCDDLRHFARLEHPVLRVDRGSLAPDLLDGDATPIGLALRGTLGHCGSYPSGQHRIGGHAERPGILGNRAREPNESVLGGGIGTAA